VEEFEVAGSEGIDFGLDGSMDKWDISIKEGTED